MTFNRLKGLEESMNKKTLLKALEYFAQGKSIKDIGQYVEIDWRNLYKTFEQLNISSTMDAKKKAKQIREELEQELLEQNANSLSQETASVPEFTPKEFEHQYNFDRAKAIAIEKNVYIDRVPQSNQHEFRNDLRLYSWKHIMKKWCAKLKLSEDELMEQAILFSPSVAKDRFGFEKEDKTRIE